MTDVDINTPDVQRPMYPRLRESLRGRTLSKWRHVDEWSDDDPAIRRVRDAHARWLMDARGRADDAAMSADSTEEDVGSLDAADANESLRWCASSGTVTCPRSSRYDASSRRHDDRVGT